MFVEQDNALRVRLEGADALLVLSVSFVECTAMVATEFKFKTIQSDGLASVASGTIGLVDELTRASITFSEPKIRLGRSDFLQWHAQRHPGRFPFEIRARFGFVDDDDIIGVGRFHSDESFSVNIDGRRQHFIRFSQFLGFWEILERNVNSCVY